MVRSKQMVNKNDMTYQFPVANEVKQSNLRYTCNAQNPSVVHQMLPSVNLLLYVKKIIMVIFILKKK